MRQQGVDRMRKGAAAMGIHAKTRSRGRTISLAALAAGATLTGLGLTAAAFDSAGAVLGGAFPGSQDGAQGYFADGYGPSGLGSPVTVADVVPVMLSPAAPQVLPDLAAPSAGPSDRPAPAKTIRSGSGGSGGSGKAGGSGASGAGSSGSGSGTGSAAATPGNGPGAGSSGGSAGTTPVSTPPAAPGRLLPKPVPAPRSAVAPVVSTVTGIAKTGPAATGPAGSGAAGPGLVTGPLESTLSAVANLPAVDSLPVVASVTHALPSVVQQASHHVTGLLGGPATAPGTCAGRSTGSAARPVTGLGSFVTSGGLASALRKLL